MKVRKIVVSKAKPRSNNVQLYWLPLCVNLMSLVANTARNVKPPYLHAIVDLTQMMKCVFVSAFLMNHEGGGSESAWHAVTFPQWPALLKCHSLFSQILLLPFSPNHIEGFITLIYWFDAENYKPAPFFKKVNGYCQKICVTARGL